MSGEQEAAAGAASVAAGIATKSGPPVTVASLSLAGVPLQDWVYIATLAWIAIQAGFYLYDRVQKARAKR